MDKKFFDNTIIAQYAVTGVPLKVYVDSRYLTITDADDVENPIIGHGMEPNGEMEPFSYQDIDHLLVADNIIDLETYNTAMADQFKPDEPEEAPEGDEEAPEEGGEEGEDDMPDEEVPEEEPEEEPTTEEGFKMTKRNLSEALPPHMDPSWGALLTVSIPVIAKLLYDLGIKNKDDIKKFIQKLKDESPKQESVYETINGITEISKEVFKAKMDVIKKQEKELKDKEAALKKEPIDELTNESQDARTMLRDLHFEIDPARQKKMKIKLGREKYGAYSDSSAIEDADYALKKFRQQMQGYTGDPIGVYDPSKDTYKAKAKAPKVQWTQKKYDQWIDDVSSNEGWRNAYDMAQNANNEPGLIDWVKKNVVFNDETPLERIQYDIEAMAESVSVKESRGGRPYGLSKEETLEVAKRFAKALSITDGVKVTVNMTTLDEDSFDLDYDGVEFDGGSYNIYDDGAVKNMATRKTPTLGYKDDSVQSIVKYLKKHYGKLAKNEAHDFPKGPSKAGVKRLIKDVEEMLDTEIDANGDPLTNETEMILQKELKRLKALLRESVNEGLTQKQIDDVEDSSNIDIAYKKAIKILKSLGHGKSIKDIEKSGNIDIAYKKAMNLLKSLMKESVNESIDGLKVGDKVQNQYDGVIATIKSIDGNSVTVVYDDMKSLRNEFGPEAKEFYNQSEKLPMAKFKKAWDRKEYIAYPFSYKESKVNEAANKLDKELLKHINGMGISKSDKDRVKSYLQKADIDPRADIKDLITHTKEILDIKEKEDISYGSIKKLGPWANLDEESVNEASLPKKGSIVKLQPDINLISFLDIKDQDLEVIGYKKTGLISGPSEFLIVKDAKGKKHEINPEYIQESVNEANSYDSWKERGNQLEKQAMADAINAFGKAVKRKDFEEMVDMFVSDREINGGEYLDAFRIVLKKYNLEDEFRKQLADLDLTKTPYEMNEDVSSPYIYQVGDLVQNVNPTCPHHGSKGIVMSVEPEELTYSVTNSGDTFKPGMRLTKTLDQLETM